MKIKQISVFIENTKGRIADVTSVLKDAGVSLKAITVADTADFGILRIITEDQDKALEALKNANFTVRTTDVLAVEISDKIGSVYDVVMLFQKNEINIEYLYASFEAKNNGGVVIIKVEDASRGQKVLEQL